MRILCVSQQSCLSFFCLIDKIFLNILNIFSKIFFLYAYLPFLESLRSMSNDIKEGRQADWITAQADFFILEYVASESSCHGKNSQPIMIQSSKICCCMYVFRSGQD